MPPSSTGMVLRDTVALHPRGHFRVQIGIAASLYFRNHPAHMRQTLGYVALVVRDYDDAIAWFTTKLQFTLVEDTRLSETRRWVLVATPGGQSQCLLLLAKAATPEQESCVGNQTGGRVFLFLHTDDFHRDYASMKARGVKFIREPRDENYGTVAVFEDLYGNKWDLLQLK